MSGNGHMKGNGAANGKGAEEGAKEAGDWFDEVLDTMDAMKPIALTDSFPIFAVAQTGKAPPKSKSEHQS